MELRFKINKYYLLAHALKSEHPPFDGWVNLPSKLWEISNNAYCFLFNPSSHDIIFTKVENDKDFDIFLNTITNDSGKIIATAFKSEEFARLYEETEKYRVSVEKEWNNKRKNITKTIEEIMGEEFPDTKIEVLITHPNLCNGIALPNSNTICWGHKENWENYSMVYLMHETLHLILDKKLGKNNLTHAIIELIADQELRIRLNKNGVYFKESKEGVGHPFLLKLSKVILPYWKKYLKSKDRNIANFYLEMKKLPKIKKFLELKK